MVVVVIRTKMGRTERRRDGPLTRGFEEVMREQGRIFVIIDEETGLGVWELPTPEEEQ